MNKSKLLIINYSFISLILALRINAMGWILLMYGLILIPFIILHVYATTIEIKNHAKNENENLILIIISSFLFFVFILFQNESDDYRQYMIIEAYMRVIFKTEYKDLSRLADYITMSSGILLIIFDSIIIYKNNKKRTNAKKNMAVANKG